MKNNKKRMTKCKNQDSIIFGVCGGIADHYDLDPFFVRLGFILLVYVLGMSAIIYLLLAIAMPDNKNP